MVHYTRFFCLRKAVPFGCKAKKRRGESPGAFAVIFTVQAQYLMEVLLIPAATVDDRQRNHGSHCQASHCKQQAEGQAVAVCGMMDAAVGAGVAAGAVALLSVVLLVVVVWLLLLLLLSEEPPLPSSVPGFSSGVLVEAWYTSAYGEKPSLLGTVKHRPCSVGVTV